MASRSAKDAFSPPKDSPLTEQEERYFEKIGNLGERCDPSLGHHAIEQHLRLFFKVSRLGCATRARAAF